MSTNEGASRASAREELKAKDKAFSGAALFTGFVKGRFLFVFNS